MRIEPVTLEGTHVRMEPLTMAHHGPLCAVADHEEIWRYIHPPARTPQEVRAFIETALTWQQARTALPFATIERATGRAVGSTRFANMVPEHRRLEIGWTWISPQWHRTPINTEAKYLMLHHAFEHLGCLRVELKTDSLNERSRNAMLRMGAKEEGTLRNHMIVAGGRFRHSVYFSVIESEWPTVKAGLEEKLAKPWTGR
ncbi:MAG: GNAT family N-acetyltransferase [Gemmataceae bacterium]|nr:GNAT family N-acetyltransferase [Gemmataceae bacterium]